MSSFTVGPIQIQPPIEAVSFYVPGRQSVPQMGRPDFRDLYDSQSTGDIGAGLKALGILDLSRLVFESELEESLKRLNELAELETDWDSYGSEPPSLVALSFAQRLIRSVAERARPRAEDQALPFFIGPLSGSGVQIEWKSTQASIEVEVDAYGSFDCLIARGRDPERKFEERHGLSLVEVVDLICSVVQ